MANEAAIRELQTNMYYTPCLRTATADGMMRKRGKEKKEKKKKKLLFARALKMDCKAWVWCGSQQAQGAAAVSKPARTLFGQQSFTQQSSPLPFPALAPSFLHALCSETLHLR